MKYWFLVFLFSYSLYAQNCDDQVSSNKGVVPVNTWNYGEDFSLTANQILPQNFIDEIESVQGKILISGKYFQGDYHFGLATSEYEEFIHWAFFLDHSDKDAIIVERLRLENPLVKKTGENLKMSQQNKGLPTEVFRFARNQIYEIARSGGFKKVKSITNQNYTVYLLYKRIVGLKPTSVEAENFANMLDAYYTFARKKLPEDLRPKSLNDFSFQLGDAGESTVSNAVIEKWKQYQKSKIWPENFEPIINEANEIIGFINQSAPVGTSKVHWLYLNGEKQEIIEWYKICRYNKKLIEIETLINI